MISSVSLSWTFDGLGLFTTGWASEGGSLLVHIDLQGREAVLWRSRTYLEAPRQSPDGKHLAFRKLILNSNAWLIENF